jgi:hypothetical protein
MKRVLWSCALLVVVACAAHAGPLGYIVNPEEDAIQIIHQTAETVDQLGDPLQEGGEISPTGIMDENRDQGNNGPDGNVIQWIMLWIDLTWSLL